MAQRKFLIAALLTLATIVTTSTHAASTPHAAQTSGWSSKMQDLYRLLADLLTHTSNSYTENEAQTHRLLSRDAAQLAQLTRSLLHETKPEQDPSLKMLMTLFSDQADRAVKEIKRGHQGYAVELLRSMPGYCIACHTRTEKGPRFSFLPISPTSTHLSHYDQGRFFAATRQFDRASNEFTQVLNEKNSASERPLEWEGAVRYALAIAVRVNQSPDQALDVVERVLKTEKAPLFIRKNAIDWKKSLQDWKAEPNRSIQTPQGYLSEAERLILKAREMQKYPADRSADILYLRGSAMVHQLLSGSAEPMVQSQGYLLAATAYQSLRDLGIEDFHEMYYEACVRTSPHTPISEQCYERLQESIFANYSGSSGLNLPEEVKNKLAQLETLARGLGAEVKP